ncbi:trimethylamine-N-oxide reductase 1 domain protein [Escherichia coli P0298942.2]|nr:hypothetical protein ECP02989421_1557 [Escherichia coli P0298942.1]ENB02043.1 hypothetical protein EC2862600_1077 [Escherichia coli 2862600]ENB43849.1 hypothetical protein ECP029894210_1074 [Escherichia coli P0298942.10]ENB50082.1 hypothetical protein ECP029894211_1121 [Escherichia coli P0298942.11]ENB65101.1 hypothetical protein ECP029894215_1128 [Escherichia coli P0298942.15]ENB65948.1 hypothetical protein ECP02989426_1099 [Escherichia coli P0298942.6]ENB69345.1 trimethylamine-N-oxide re
MNNNDLFQASRRRFLAQLGGLTVAGMLGPSLLTPRRATAAQAGTVLHPFCWTMKWNSP